MKHTRGMRLIWSFALMMLALSAVALGFFFLGALRNNTWDYWFLLWNLCLAWVPFLLSVLWVRVGLRKGFRSSAALALGLGWLLFLPNSFYPISDYLHLVGIERVDPLQDIAMLTLVVAVSSALGFVSLYMVHSMLLLRKSARSAHVSVAMIILLCSFAIYLGRNLRWSTWDVLVSPAGLLFDVSSRIVAPHQHLDTFVTTATFFVLIGSLYWAVYGLVSQSRAR